MKACTIQKPIQKFQNLHTYNLSNKHRNMLVKVCNLKIKFRCPKKKAHCKLIIKHLHRDQLEMYEDAIIRLRFSQIGICRERLLISFNLYFFTSPRVNS